MIVNLTQLALDPSSTTSFIPKVGFFVVWQEIQGRLVRFDRSANGEGASHLDYQKETRHDNATPTPLFFLPSPTTPTPPAVIVLTSQAQPSLAFTHLRRSVTVRFVVIMASHCLIKTDPDYSRPPHSFGVPTPLGRSISTRSFAPGSNNGFTSSQANPFGQAPSTPFVPLQLLTPSSTATGQQELFRPMIRKERVVRKTTRNEVHDKYKYLLGKIGHPLKHPDQGGLRDEVAGISKQECAVMGPEQRSKLAM